MPREGPSRDEGTDFLAALRERWWIPLACAAVLGLGAFLVARLGHRDYEGVALLQVNNANLAEDIVGVASNSGTPIQNVLAETPPQIHQRSIARRAARALEPHPSLTPDQVLAATSVSVDTTTGLIPVTATASNPKDAARIANALARAYIHLRQSQDFARIHRARVELEKTAAARAHANPNNPAAASDLSSLNDRIEQLRLTEKIRPASVALTRPATPPSSLSGFAPGLFGVAGALLGLIIGLAIVAVRAREDERILSVRDLERALQVPLLTRIPRTRALRNRRPFSKLAPREGEPFRLLLALLRHAPGSAAARSVAVTSAASNEGKSTTAWYLAATAAASGERTLLLQTDDARPSALTSDGNGRQAGLNALMAGASLPEVVTQVDVTEGNPLDVISPGPQNGFRDHLARPDVVARTFERLGAAYDFIIIETPPLPLAANAVPFVREADGVVAVCRKGIVDRGSAELLREAIEGLHARFLGVAAVGFGRGNRYP